MMLDYNPVPFDHTYILYDPNDIIAKICVQFSLLPIYLMVFYTSWFLITREIEPVIIVGGHLINELINKIIKVSIKSPRPDFHKNFGRDGGSYGMTYGFPSAHSQFMGFFAGYYICVILLKVPMPKSSKKPICLFAAISMMGVAFSRVYLLYHSNVQVIAGLITGVTLGIIYFIITSVARDVGLVEWILNWPIIKYFYVKDTYYHIYQTFAEEYEVYLQLRRERNEALLSAIIGNEKNSIGI